MQDESTRQPELESTTQLKTLQRSSIERSNEMAPLLIVSQSATLWKAIKDNAIMSFNVTVGREVVTLANFFSMMMLSKKAHGTLVATPLMLGVYRIFFSWSTTPLNSLAIHVAQASGNPDMKIKIQKISIGHQQSFLFALCLAGSSMPVLYYIRDILTDGLKQPKDAAETLSVFCRALMPGMFAISVYSNDLMMLVALGKSQFFKWSNLFTSAVGLALCYPLIYTANLGEKGFAYAQIAQFAVGILTSRLYIGLTKDELISKLSLYNPKGFTYLSQLCWLARKGLQSFVQQASEIFAFTGLIMLAGAYSETALIQENVIQQYLLGVLLMPMMSIGQSTVKLCGKPYGELKTILESDAAILSAQEMNNVLRLYTNIKLAAQASIINNVCLTFGMSAILCAGSNLFSKAFLNDEQLADTTNLEDLRILFAILMLAQTLDAMRNSLCAVSNALTNTTVPMVNSFVLSLGLNLALAWILGFYYNFGLRGIQSGPVIPFVLSNIALSLYTYDRFTKLLVRIHTKAENFWPADRPVPKKLSDRIFSFFRGEKTQAPIQNIQGDTDHQYSPA